VFFTDGEFVGPNQFGLWESITSEAKMRMEVARAARDGIGKGIPAADVLDEIGKIIGPSLVRRPGPSPDKLSIATKTVQEMIANEISRERQSRGDDHTVDLLASQADTQLPNFRKR
jgi:hypothetical protein